MASSETPQTFGELLARTLDENRLSGRAFAKRLAEASGRKVEDERRAVSRWIKSVDGPKDENRARIAAALELPPDHPLIAGRPRAAVLGVLAQLEARVARLEGLVGLPNDEGGHRGRRAVDG